MIVFGSNNITSRIPALYKNQQIHATVTDLHLQLALYISHNNYIRRSRKKQGISNDGYQTLHLLKANSKTHLKPVPDQNNQKLLKRDD